MTTETRLDAARRAARDAKSLIHDIPQVLATFFSELSKKEEK